MVFTGQKSTPYIADIIAQHGIQQVVVCPGSRNAPLTLAFSRHGDFTLFSIVDERTAGYFALGLALESQKPIVVICTSGTAVLNLAPAVAEAYFQGIPLLVITADRPEAWVGQQDGQAISQKNVFANIVAQSFSMPGELFTTEHLWFTERNVNEACMVCRNKKEPVHINISFSEPLYSDGYEKHQGRYFSSVHAVTHDRFAWDAHLNTGKKILLLVGQLNDPGITEVIKKLSLQKNLVVMAENLSNLPSFAYIHNASELTGFAGAGLSPDYIIQVGGPIVSKRLKNYIRGLSPQHFISLSSKENVIDTFQQLTMQVRGDVKDLLEDLSVWNKTTGGDSSYAEEWKKVSEKGKDLRNKYLGQVEFSDLKVFSFIAEHVPAEAHIHLANSTPVRYAQLVNDSYADDVVFLSNRGTSGIDGSISTAVGYSYTSEKLNILITGDLSFQYDSNAFFHAYLKSNLKVIVINNAGGNIFRVIDGPAEQPERADFFETSLTHHFQHLAAHFNLGYFKASGMDELKKIWDTFISPDCQRPAVLEVFTDAETSANVFKNLYKYLQQEI